MRKEATTPVISLFLILCILCVGIRSTGMAVANYTTSTIPVNVGVVADMGQWTGKMWVSCIKMALSDFYASHAYYKTRLVLNIRDSKDDVVGVAAAALDLLKNVEVRAIIGPVTSMLASFVISLGNKAQVPIISFSATSPSLSPSHSPYFVRVVQKDSSQVRAIIDIVQAFGWREVIPIYVDNEFGEAFMPFLADGLQAIDTRIPYRSAIPASITDDKIHEELDNLKKMKTRVFIVHMVPPLASRLFTIVKKIGMMSKGYAWIVTDTVTNGLISLERSVIDSMHGVIGIKPYVPRTKQLEKFMIQWKTKFQQDNPTILNAKLDVFGLLAYDAATALAIATEKVDAPSSGFQLTNNVEKSTDLENFGFSHIGPKLLKALLNITFTGLSGDFHIVDGELRSSAYQIVNVIGKGRRVIGFWTTEKGIVRELSGTSKTAYSTSKASLGSIIWPGDTTTSPKGWELATRRGLATVENVLRIGVPVKKGFLEFVNATLGQENVTGFCIDVFEAVMANLSHQVTYKYVPYNLTDDDDYNMMVSEVYRGRNFSAGVGDITIIANRTNYVDFALPYIDSGISMVFPTRDNKVNKALMFLEPLTLNLWLASFCVFVFVGFAVWVLEHRINEEFRGSPSHQAGTIFMFIFSTMAFAQRERVMSNLTRVLVIIWCFVVIILVQSYAANFSSILTVDRLRPTVPDLKGESVGYQYGSFVGELLIKEHFDKSKMKKYKSVEELNDLLTKGSSKGGIAAAVDETPYIRLFLSKYCSDDYKMVPLPFRTDGFGFMFQINFPLLHNISNAVLNVTQGKQIEDIEKKWFGKTKCLDTNTTDGYHKLGLDSFWGLFLFAGIVSFFAVLASITSFLYKHKDILRDSGPRGTFWSKIGELVKRFDEKDLPFHTSNASQRRNQNHDPEASSGDIYLT